MRASAATTCLLLCIGLIAIATTVIAPGRDPSSSMPAPGASSHDESAAADTVPTRACELFSGSEIASFVGMAVLPGRSGGAQGVCQWATESFDAEALLIVMPRHRFEQPYWAIGFKTLPAPGRDGYVLPEMGGWTAGSIVGERAITVSISGPGANEQTTVAFLRVAIERMR